MKWLRIVFVATSIILSLLIIYAIINCEISYKYEIENRCGDKIDIFVKAGYEVVAYPTQAYRDAYKKIKKYDSSEYDLIVCSGGDGTLDEVVTGMMKRDRDKREPIGYIPTGTTNDFASSLHIPRGLLEAADMGQGYNKQVIWEHGLLFLLSTDLFFQYQCRII